LHYSDYPQFNHQAQLPAYQAPQPLPQSSLEEMMKVLIQSTDKFVQATDKNIQELKNGNQELKNATMANSRDIQELKSSIARIEGQTVI
jgi:predicted RNase H-like nuclease (RuvC/YqgF family)